MLLLAFVLRAMIPTGFMPGQAAGPEGGLSVVICTANGLKLFDAGDDGEPEGGGADQHAGEPCIFSSVQPLAVADSPPAGPLPAQFEAAVVKLAHDVTLPPVRAGPALGSRGPPIFL